MYEEVIEMIDREADGSDSLEVRCWLCSNPSKDCILIECANRDSCYCILSLEELGLDLDHICLKQ